MNKSKPSRNLYRIFVFKKIGFFTFLLFLFSYHLFAQTNPYQSDIVSVGSMEMLSGPVKAIAAGDSHTVALKEDGTVVAWGYNFYGQTTIPAGLANVCTGPQK